MYAIKPVNVYNNLSSVSGVFGSRPKPLKQIHTFKFERRDKGEGKWGMWQHLNKMVSRPPPVILVILQLGAENFRKGRRLFDSSYDFKMPNITKLHRCFHSYK